MKIPFVFFAVLVTAACLAQDLKSENVIVITLDGYRWVELFEGADRKILSLPKYTDDQTAIQKFGNGTASERREALMPFFWNVIAREGQLYGNRKLKSKVNCVNNHLLSYPGYSEMLVGFPERSVSSNDKEVNPNPTVFEFIHRQQGFQNKVAAFATWDVFPYIFREDKSEIFVSAGDDQPDGALTSRERAANAEMTRIGKRQDDHTFTYAFEYLKRDRPRLMFIGFDGTDNNGHGGRYDEYLYAAHAIDSMIATLWAWVQSDPGYKNRTTLLITTDHGRGYGKHTWKNHRLLARGSRHIWFAVLGPDTPAFGEMRVGAKYYQKQIAKTVAAFLGIRYTAAKPAGEIVQTMIGVAHPLIPAEETDTARGQ